MRKLFRGFLPPENNRSRFVIEMMSIFTIIIIVLFGLFYIQTSRDIYNQRVSVELSDYATIEFQEEYIFKEIERIENDLLFITKMKAFKDLVEQLDDEDESLSDIVDSNDNVQEEAYLESNSDTKVLLTKRRSRESLPQRKPENGDPPPRPEDGDPPPRPEDGDPPPRPEDDDYLPDYEDDDYLPDYEDDDYLPDYGDDDYLPDYEDDDYLPDYEDDDYLPDYEDDEYLPRPEDGEFPPRPEDGDQPPRQEDSEPPAKPEVVDPPSRPADSQPPVRPDIPEEIGMPQGDTQKDMLQRDIGFYMNISDFYEEIIYVDENGLEVFHMNRFDGILSYVPNEHLRDLSKLEFYLKTMSMEKGELYHSPIEEIRLKEDDDDIRQRIRIATRVYDTDGIEKGVIAIVYNTSGLFNDFERIGGNSVGDNYLLDANGHVLVGSITPSSTSVFEDSRVHLALDENYNNIEVISDGESGNYVQQFYSDEGLITTVVIGEERSFENNSQWYAVSAVLEESSPYIDNDESLDFIITEFIKMWPYGILLIIISWGIALIISYRRKFVKEITEMAQIDSMTGAFNRNAGITILDSSLKYATKGKRDFSICFIDVNDLKKVNDQLGHEMGDAYLIDAVMVLRKGFREADHLIRLGGDEFVIGIQGDVKVVEKNWGRVLDAVEAFNKEAAKPYKISLSHGVASAHELTDVDIDNLIAMADERMYQEKKKIKAARVE